jgi:hypothetical protein
MKAQLMESNPSLKAEHVLDNSSPSSFSYGPLNGPSFMTNIPPIAVKNLNKSFKKQELTFTPEKKDYQKYQLE